jgi:alpha-tubulin suppressor-like RCC1 family protein
LEEVTINYSFSKVLIYPEGENSNSPLNRTKNATPNSNLVIESKGLVNQQSQQQREKSQPNTDKSSFPLPDSVVTNMGFIRQIACGKHQILHLTEDGYIFSYGDGKYGTHGHCGGTPIPLPKALLSLNKKSIIQIACGEAHSLALTGI